MSIKTIKITLLTLSIFVTPSCGDDFLDSEIDFRSAFCRQESKKNNVCKATCVLDDLGLVACSCKLPTDKSGGSCECCASDGTCATGKYDSKICQ